MKSLNKKIPSITQAKKIALDEITKDCLERYDEGSWEKEFNEKHFLENPPCFKDELTLDLYWGYVFFYDGKKAIKENGIDYNYSYFYRPPILIDKFTGELTKFHLMPDKNLDEELEKYRRSKGY